MTLTDGWPPFYAERKSSADVDTAQLYLAFVVAALACALFLVLPGVRGLERTYFVMRWTLSLLIGALIIASGQGASWQVADVTADFRYKVTSDNLTTFNVGLHIGLTQFNVTLKGSSSSGKNYLNMNEQFFFVSADEMIEKALFRGIPFPILTIAEHFSSKSFHSLWPWGRKYWLAGHYGSYLLWTALACWIVTNVIFPMTLAHGSIFMILTGILLLSANISFTSVNAGDKLVITLGYNDPPSQLNVAYGWCFWVTLSVGLLCVLLGIAAYVLQKFRKRALEKFFMIQEDEEVLISSSSRDSLDGAFSVKEKSRVDFVDTSDSAKRRHHVVKRVMTGQENYVFEEESDIQTATDAPVRNNDDQEKRQDTSKI